MFSFIELMGEDEIENVPGESRFPGYPISWRVLISIRGQKLMESRRKCWIMRTFHQTVGSANCWILDPEAIAALQHQRLL